MSSGRARLPYFVVASVALHVLALVALPVWLHVNEPAVARVLDVVLLQPEPPPVAQPQPEERRDPEPLAPPAARVRQAQRTPPRVATAPATPDVVPAPQSAAPAAAVAAEAPVAFPAPVAAPSAESAARAAPAPIAEPRPAAFLPPVFNAAYLRNPPPRYPLAARRNGEQGTVTLRVLVSAEGVPASVGVEQTSGSRHLDQAALETVRSWRFVPARRGDQAVEAWVLVPIVFRLEGAS